MQRLFLLVVYYIALDWSPPLNQISCECSLCQMCRLEILIWPKAHLNHQNCWAICHHCWSSLDHRFFSFGHPVSMTNNELFDSAIKARFHNGLSSALSFSCTFRSSTFACASRSPLWSPQSLYIRSPCRWWSSIVVFNHLCIKIHISPLTGAAGHNEKCYCADVLW
jgi:hypothetical protein